MKIICKCHSKQGEGLEAKLVFEGPPPGSRSWLVVTESDGKM